MTRCTSVSHFLRAKRGAPTQDIPREGTHLREVYDLFQSSKGVPIEWSPGNRGKYIMDLTDFYGLDIRRLQSGNSRSGRKSQYVLAGEWIGRVYIDYIAERLKAG